MLHGWGVNSAVFTPLHDALQGYCVHYVDLPGFGHSPAIKGDIDDWVETIVHQVPESAIWIGWSLGGLIASRTALRFPGRVKALVTIASSPCFMARESESWPGIAPQVLTQFATDLEQNLPKMVERFLAIQAMGSESAKQDIKQLRELVMARPLPDSNALKQGLAMLQHVDLRPELDTLKLPWLRLWGRLDGLVSRRVPPLLPQADGQIQDTMFLKASHAPFISHTTPFCEALLGWLRDLNERC
ncbi:pimeloyl-ACP methyl ester esterase BioH [Shewanella sp. AS1]|nr:pimeloyl-ACP methyl ester esterase BioH [Shewanella sp. AS1]